MTQFQGDVIKVVKNIPRGSAMTYKEVAEKSGHPGAYRAVGSLMKKNFDSSIPCHRVIKSNGDLGEYNRGKENKKTLLKEEGYSS
jgi:methylated-DNA-[protein]-cysteine S-methyltransferase